MPPESELHASPVPVREVYSVTRLTREVRALLDRARELFGANPVEPPSDIAPDRDAVKTWIR